MLSDRVLLLSSVETSVLKPDSALWQDPPFTESNGEVSTSVQRSEGKVKRNKSHEEASYKSNETQPPPKAWHPVNSRVQR